MKNFFILAVATLFVTNAWAYPVYIDNRTNQEVTGHFTYVLCPDSHFRVPAGSYRLVDDKAICCIKYAKVDGFNQSIEPSRTGFGITCKSVKIVVENTQAGGIVARAEDLPQ